MFPSTKPIGKRILTPTPPFPPLTHKYTHTHHLHTYSFLSLYAKFIAIKGEFVVQ